VVNRRGLAVPIAAVVSGSLHDFRVLRYHAESLAQLVRQHAGERTKIPADKGYVGDTGNGSLALVTPRKPPPRSHLTAEDARPHRRLSSTRVLFQNYFGRLTTKFDILIRWWGYNNDYYLVIFEICCANFDIKYGRGRGVRDEDENNAEEKQIKYDKTTSSRGTGEVEWSRLAKKHIYQPGLMKLNSPI
jgi:hypothetical protein